MSLRLQPEIERASECRRDRPDRCPGGSGSGSAPQTPHRPGPGPLSYAGASGGDSKMTSKTGSADNRLGRHAWSRRQQLCLLALGVFALLGVWGTVSLGARPLRTDGSASEPSTTPIRALHATADQVADHKIGSASRMLVASENVTQVNRAFSSSSTAMVGSPGQVYSADLANTSCEPLMSQAVRRAHALTDLLWPDPSGRTPSSSGLEAVGAPTQQRWVRDQLRLIEEACARGSDVEAVWRLEDVQDVLQAQRNPRSGIQPSRCQMTTRLATGCAVAADLSMGRRTVNVEPAPSRLSTAIAPSWSASTIATR